MAKKETYVYDEENFQYVKEERNLRYYLRRSTWYLVGSLGLGLVFIYLFFVVYDSPKTRVMNEQNAVLASTIDQNQQALEYFGIQLDSLKEAEKDIYRTALNAEPEEDTDTDEGYGFSIGTELNETNLELLEEELEELNRQMSQTTYTSAVILEMANMRQEELRSLPTIRPVKGEIISGFGIRMHPIHKEDRQHNGIDFRADVGTPVVSTGDGVVVGAGVKANGLGNYIDIRHEKGYVSRYAHLDEINVRMGQQVERGQVIATSGASGLCKGPHLHYQIHKDGVPIDPIDFFYTDLSPQEFLDFKKKASQYNESMN